MTWQLYADDNANWIVNNHGVQETLTRRENWANNVQDWVDGEDNTNLVYLTGSKLGSYANRSTGIYKCPADREPALNGQRIRSMSMNALVGNPGELTNCRPPPAPPNALPFATPSKFMSTGATVTALACFKRYV